MPPPTLTTDYRDKARKCRFLAKSAEDRMAIQLFFLADAYEAAAQTFERADEPGPG